jgi:hypothetical protein
MYLLGNCVKKIAYSRHACAIELVGLDGVDSDWTDKQCTRLARGLQDPAFVGNGLLRHPQAQHDQRASPDW